MGFTIIMNVYIFCDPQCYGVGDKLILHYCKTSPIAISLSIKTHVISCDVFAVLFSYQFFLLV